MANVLVTGGAGYIGSLLVPELLGEGHKVHVVDNFMYGQNSLAAMCADENFSVTKLDVRNISELKPHLSKSDIVIPLAALVGAPICAKDPIGAQTVNHDSVLDLFKNLSRQQLILMPTTNSAYGSGDENNMCTENSPLNPISKYAIDKVAIEKELMQRENSISFRLATVFGMSPRMRIDLLVNDFTYRAITDRFVVLFESSFKRNYIHIRDVVRVFIHGIVNFNSMKGEIFNVGLSDLNLSKLELCERIKKHVPEFVYLDAPVGKDPDQRNYIVSNKKLEKTGFKQHYSLDFGINELLKGYRMLRNTTYGNV
ncbi:MAG: SDR family oxidoreductase [Betaproteobacteria bacterium]|nr:SDR family oxidoreductase [Betaproteobacteria bacterium]